MLSWVQPSLLLAKSEAIFPKWPVIVDSFSVVHEGADSAKPIYVILPAYILWYRNL